MTTTDMPTKGTITRWLMGQSGPEWATLRVDFGPFTAKVAMTSREARAFAIDVLTDQGPYLGYQPPNESMRENKNAGILGHGRSTSGNVPWRERGKVNDLAEKIADLREQYGDDSFAWALQRVLDA